MITGLPKIDIEYNENVLSDTDEKLNAIFEVIGVSLDSSTYDIKVFDSTPEQTTLAVKIIFENLSDKYNVMKEAKCLKDCDTFKGVYIKNDESKLARNENYRLRKKSRSLRADYPHSVIKIEKGKLLQDGVAVDTFDINNQIFC